ncbi:GNAT family protein [uncultured Williamsia sp.]|uniref:GNAT family N-acetyltransferase n=1 Tax=uncultured Williamsia sp. TaxID=259311 RepID=UPI0026155FA7|nr:GNAT family protein [uncultured Williamsia sp.]
MTSASRTNEFGQPVGEDVVDWQPPPRPSNAVLRGTHCTLEPLDADRHADDLFAAYAAAPDGRDWTYLPLGPFATIEEFRAWAEPAAAGQDPFLFAVVDTGTGRAVGTLALMRQDPANGVVEVGYVMFSRALQGTRASTEAQYLLMRHAFELGYRRYEWKCDSFNDPSRRAAARLGFTYEGTFRQAVVYKGRTRDTAWFSILDSEWPDIRTAFETWLDPANFDADGRQRAPLRTNP